MRKESFERIIDRLKKNDENTDVFCDILEKLSPGDAICAFIYTENDHTLNMRS